MFFIGQNIVLIPLPLLVEGSQTDFGMTADYFVDATSGDDEANGTSPETAWQTISKVNSSTFSGGERIAFKAGEVWNEILTVPSSGSFGNIITFGAYGSGDKPKIYGSEVITGWTLHSGNIYKATFATDIEQLFVDGTRMTLARYPNSGYTTDAYTSAWNGGTCIGRNTGYTFSDNVITSSGSLTGANGNLITNKLAFLDSAGEWYYDTSTNTVYLWTPNGDSPSGYTVRGSTKQYNINLNNQDYITIENLILRDCYDTGVYGSGTNYITIDLCDILYAEQIGVRIESATNTTITNNTIHGMNKNAMRIFSSSAIITGNTITDIGLFENFHKIAEGQNIGTAINMRGDNSTINYNVIDRCGYDGINFYGINTMVKYNYITDAMLVQSDGGAIYTYNSGTPTASAGSEVHYNIIVGSNGSTTGYTNSWGDAHGIYMDDHTSDIDIKYNTVINCRNGAGIFLHVADNIDVQYNTVFDFAVGLLTGSETGDSYYYNNIVYAIDTVASTVWWTNSHQRLTKIDGATSVYDNNTYIHHYMTDNQFNNDYNFSEWKSAVSGDTSSTFDDEQFTTETEDIFINPTASTKTFYLNGATAKDIDGNSITTSFTVAAWGSKIVTGTDLNLITE